MTRYLTVFKYVLISLLFCTYSFYVLKPTIYKNFSLIDDGQTIQNSIFIDNCFKSHVCNNVSSVLIENQFGRFRPFYWVLNYVQFKYIGLNPALHHEFRIYGIGVAIVLLMSYLIILEGGNFLGLLLGVLFFATSFTFTENIVRLGPTEPFQLIFLCLFLITLKNNFRYKIQFAVLFFILSCLIKETSFIVTIPLIINDYYFNKSKDNKHLSMYLFVLGLGIFLLGRILSHPEQGVTTYVDNFKFGFSFLLTNFFQYVNLIQITTSPFLKIILIIFLATLLRSETKRYFFESNIVVWFLNFLIFFIVLVPWKYVLERYVFISMFSFSILLALITTDFSKQIFFYFNKLNFKYNLIYKSVFYLIFINIFFYSVALSLGKSINYVNWYSSFIHYEQDKVNAIARQNTSVVFVNSKDNLDSWEELYELPIHINYIYKQKKTIERIDTLPKSGYVFSSSSLPSTVNEFELTKYGYSKIDSQSYLIGQIDPIEFKKKFILKPIDAIINTRATSNLLYSWSMYKK